MAHEFKSGSYRQTNLEHQSAEYRAKREALRGRGRADGAPGARGGAGPSAARRPAVREYEFVEGPADLTVGDTPLRTVELSELFTAPDRSLVIYHAMHGKKQVKPCPMCTLWVDGFNGIAPHITQNVDFAVVAAAGPAAPREHARARGWNQVRLLSAGASSCARPQRASVELGTPSRDHRITL